MTHWKPDTRIVWESRKKDFFLRDNAVVQSMGETGPVLQKLLVGGELPLDALGDIGIANILTYNTMYEEDFGQDALFLTSSGQTVLLARWPAYPQSALDKTPLSNGAKRLLMELEARRIGLSRFKFGDDQAYNFYQGCLEAEELYGQITLIDAYADFMYFNAMTLFNKAYFRNMAPETFFCSFKYDMGQMALRGVDEDEAFQAAAAYNSRFTYPVLSELRFLTKLYEKYIKNS